MGKLEIEIADGIGWVYISNEARRNAIDETIINEFKDVLDQCESNDQIKVMVITGKGNQSFCSGGDLSVFHQLYTEQEAYNMLSKMSENLFRIFTFPKPTIALLNGTAVGGGCEIAAACDFRVAMSHAKYGFIQGKLGITTGWGGSTYLFERIPKDIALYLLASGQIIPVENAKDQGFVQRIFKMEGWEDQLEEWLKPILQMSLPVLRAYKTRLLDSYNLEKIRNRVDTEVRQCAMLWESDEHHQQVKSFLSKKS